MIPCILPTAYYGVAMPLESLVDDTGVVHKPYYLLFYSALK